jgi:hypothetical protein
MNCRRCNTPIPSRSSSCPNCGQHVGSGESFIDDPGDSGVESAAEESLLGPSTLSDMNVEVDVEEDVEIDLDEEEEELSLEDAVVDVAPAKAPSVRQTSKPQKAPAGRSSKSAAPSKPAASRRPKDKPAGSRDVRQDGAEALLPDPETVRSILAQHPELIEPGLEILSDDAGREIGVQHATDVGVVDVIARDANGSLVAVMVAGSDSGSDLVGEALHRLGWIRKHLAKDGEDVRGVVLTDHLDEQVAYAAAAVSGTLGFKSYALSLTLVDLDV